ncbi:hypothetical protein E5L49_03345 [Helicobacter pylori]|nr:hypothetical protein E5L49_03345 [Helicobacter pylori]
MKKIKKADEKSVKNLEIKNLEIKNSKIKKRNQWGLAKRKIKPPKKIKT